MIIKFIRPFLLTGAINQAPQNHRQKLDLGVIDTINPKNLGMYGVGNGMFEARH